MDPKVRQAWEDFLNPEVTRNRLLAASVYIAAFEALKDSIVGRIRDFFWNLAGREPCGTLPHSSR
jgi:hypothetical protein